VNTTTLSFGDVETGQSPSKSFNISNTGKADLKVNSIASSNGFSATHNCGTVKPNASCSVTVTFKPTQAQPYSHTLNITSNASNGTQQVAVSGNGIQAPQIKLEIDKQEVKVPEEGTETFNVSLSAKPRQDVPVTVSKLSGDPDIGVQSGNNLTFKPDNWNVPQKVTVAAAKDDDIEDGTATLSISASEDSKEVVIIEVDGDKKKTIRLAVVNPPKTPIKPGESFDITLQFVPDTAQPADGIQVYIEFDPEKLKINSVKNSGVLDFEMRNKTGEDKDGNGYINFAAISLFNDVPTEPFDLVTINFTALENIDGADSTKLIFDPDKSLVSSGDEYIPQNYEDIMISLAKEETVLKCQVSLQGRPTPPTPSWITQLEISVGSKQYPEIITDDEGYCEIPEPPSGTHSICVKNSHTLRNKVESVTIPLADADQVIDLGLLIEGDLDNDNDIEFKDARSLAVNIVSCQNNPADCNANFDLNGDGSITEDDLALLRENYANEEYFPDGATSKQGAECTTNKKRGIRRITPRRDNSTATIRTSPIPASIVVGSSFNVAVLIDADARQPVDAAVAHLNFDPQLLEVNEIIAGQHLDYVLKNHFDNSRGQVNFAAILFKGTLPTETINLMTVNFTLLDEGGERTLAFNTSKPRQTDIAFDGISVSSPIEENGIVFVDNGIGTVSGNLRDAFGNPIANARVIIGDLEATSDEQGHYEITGVPAGSHPVIVESDGQNFQSQTITVSGEDNAPIRLDLVSDWDKTWICPIYALQDHKRSDTQPFMIDPITGTVYADENLVYLNADIEGLSLHPVTGELYCSSGDMTDKPGYLCKINRHTGELTYIGATGFKEVDSLAFHPDGSLWGWAVREGLITIDSETGQGTLFVPYDKEFVEDMVWSHDGQLLYATQDHNLWAYDGQILHLVCDNLPNQVEAIEMLPGEVLLFAFDGDNHIRFWDIKRCTEIWEDEAFEMPSNFNDIEGISSPSTCQPQ
jgi:hypothetical protein